MTEKKNPDYSASAVNLTNPPQVRGLLLELQSYQNALSEYKAKAESLIPEGLKQMIKTSEVNIDSCMKNIKQAIDEFGSYQNPDKGEYAVKQLKRTKLYSATNFESCFPEYATAVLTKSINVPVLEGLIKGNLLSEDGLRRAHIIEDKESFAYIVR